MVWDERWDKDELYLSVGLRGIIDNYYDLKIIKLEPTTNSNNEDNDTLYEILQDIVTKLPKKE